VVIEVSAEDSPVKRLVAQVTLAARAFGITAMQTCPQAAGLLLFLFFPELAARKRPGA
jgi:hypothetical protein